MEIINRIEQWYQGQCNGDWEHSYGISIETLDNPGWKVKIDLAETKYRHLLLPRVQINRTEDNWVHYHIANSVFIAYGGVANLMELFDVFFMVCPCPRDLKCPEDD